MTLPALLLCAALAARIPEDHFERDVNFVNGTLVGGNGLPIE